MPEPIVFIRSGMWWAQTNDQYGLVTGTGSTRMQAIKAWRRQYDATKLSMQGQ